MSDIRTESANRVLSIILDRPAKKNAITDAMYGDIATALARAADDPETGAVLIRGEGPDFCAGNDISMFAAAAAGEQNILASNIGSFLEAISTFPKPLVAAVTGQAIGIGVTMLLHCDLVYIAGDAELRTPFIDLGLVPEAASALMLPERIGHVRSFALFALAETLSGAEAATIGIANRALPADEVERAAELAARTLAGKPLSALVATKALMRNAEAIAAALDADQKAFAAQIQTPEAAAAFAAFAARKGPPAS